MRQWYLAANRLVCQRAASFATWCWMFCGVAFGDWQTRLRRRQSCDVRPTTSSLAVHAGNMHTRSTYKITALTRSTAFLPAFVSAAMTKWCVVASKLVSEQDRSFAVRCSTVWRITLVEGCRCNLRRRGRHVRHAKSGKASSPADNKHTHWTRRIPDRYTMLAWGLALVSAFVSATTNRINPVFVVHLFSCVFACQALRALAKGRRPTGWIKKARVAGRSRVKARRRQTQPLYRTQVLLAVLVVVSPGTLHCVHTVSYKDTFQANHMWWVARKLRNQLMRALHGNTMHRTKRTRTEKKDVNNATCSHADPATLAETSNPTPLKQKSEVEANVTQYALWTSEYSPAHNQSAEEVVDLDQLAQARIGCDITKVPGDGWCFFHAVSRHCSKWNTWSITHAAELYLQALEWLCNQKYGPRAEDVQLACVPFDDRELELHKQYLLRAHKSNPSLAELTDSEIVLLSKLVAVLQKPRALDSIHHGSFVELWALSQRHSIFTA